MKRALKAIVRTIGVERPQFAAARTYCERQWLAAFGREHKRYVGRIPRYHTVGQSERGVNDVTPAQARRALQGKRIEAMTDLWIAMSLFSQFAARITSLSRERQMRRALQTMLKPQSNSRAPPPLSAE